MPVDAGPVLNWELMHKQTILHGGEFERDMYVVRTNSDIGIYPFGKETLGSAHEISGRWVVEFFKGGGKDSDKFEFKEILYKRYARLLWLEDGSLKFEYDKGGYQSFWTLNPESALELKNKMVTFEYIWEKDWKAMVKEGKIKNVIRFGYNR